MAEEERDDPEFNEEERLFELEEAEELLPQLRGWLLEALEHRKQAESIEKEFLQVQNRILLYGGILPPHSYLSEKRLERDSYVKLMQEALGRIAETGCLVKDLEKGLLDFPAVLNDERVYLCWMLGEDHIGFWHGVHEGFAGRKPLEPLRGGSPPGDKPN